MKDTLSLHDALPICLFVEPGLGLARRAELPARLLAKAGGFAGAGQPDEEEQPQADRSARSIE